MLGQGDPSEEALVRVINSFAWAERVIVVAEALMARLPGRPGLAARLLDACLQPGDDPPQPPVHAAATMPVPQSASNGPADGRHNAASREEPVHAAPLATGRSGLQAEEEISAGVLVRDIRDRALLVALIQKQPVSAGLESESASSQQESASEASSRAASGRRRSSSADEAGTEDWGPPLQTVRLLQCEYGASEGQAASAVKTGEAGISSSKHEHVHQLYARVRPGELRIASVVLMES